MLREKIKNWKMELAAVLVFVLVLGMTGLSGSVKAADQTDLKTIDIMFVHDTHSHLNSFSTVVDEKQEMIGGFARIKTLIDEQKEKAPDTLVVDGGDFSMGTLVQTVFETQAAEIRMLGALGCEATTLGNHEFDYRSKGLAKMLETAAESGDTVPELLVCNINWDAMEQQGFSEGQQQIRDAFTEYGVKDYVMVQKGDVRVALLGVFGKDALACAPTCELQFTDPVEAVKKTVAEIKKNEDADIIVCLSHSGTSEDESKSEDEILAKKVPDLDVIVSAHTHTKLDEPIVHGDTYIVSAGEYGKYLGSLSLEQKDDGRWNMKEYKLTPIETDIAENAATQEEINSFMATVDTDYLAQFGFTREQVLAENDVAFDSLEDLYNIHTEHNLGDLIADAYAYAVTNSTDYNGTPVDVAIAPSGTIRDTYTKGNITVEDVFNSFSLGIGADGVPGYPLIEAYLTGKELKTVAEIDASVSDLMTSARLYMYGLQFTYNPHRMILNRVTDVYLLDADGNRRELEDDKLYRVVADLYSGQMLSAVTKTSYGLLSVVPKKADGTPIENFEDVILTDNGGELKAWTAIAHYMESFPDENGDGIADIPQYYAGLHERKVVDDSANLVKLIKNPNKYAVMIAGVVLIAILLVVLLIRLVLKLVKYQTGKRRSGSKAGEEP